MLSTKLKQLSCTFFTFALLSLAATSHGETLPPFDQWQQKDFVGTNKFVYSHQDNTATVQMDSDQTASGLFLEQQIDLNKTPLLNWSWKISNTLHSLKERTKSGDDYSARVYVLTSTGPFPWQKKSISYVWSNYQNVGESWPNPYTDSVVMVAVDSGKKHQGTWQHHQRDVQKDLQAAFGKKFDKIDVIAVMTDADNSKQKTSGWYRGFEFSSK